MITSLGDLESAARVVYAAMPPTAQQRWPLLDARCGAAVWVKHENHTPVGAFKIRGGLVYFDHLRRTQPGVKGVVAATRGNHGQSIAYAARREWGRVAASLVLTALFAGPVLFMSAPGLDAAGASLSLFHQASPAHWAVAAGIAGLGAIAIASLRPRYALLAAGTAAVVALPRLLLYDLTFVSVGLTRMRDVVPAPESQPERASSGLYGRLRSGWTTWIWGWVIGPPRG